MALLSRPTLHTMKALILRVCIDFIDIFSTIRQLCATLEFERTEKKKDYRYGWHIISTR